MFDIENQKYAVKLGVIFGLVTGILCGIFIFAKGLDAQTLVYSLSIIIPASLCIGTLGFLIGKIFDNEEKKESSNQMFK